MSAAEQASNHNDDDLSLDEQTTRQVLGKLNLAIAVVRPGAWTVAYENAKFFQWFPGTGEADETLASRVPGLPLDRLGQRMERGRPFSFETEAKAGGRPVPVKLEFRPLVDGEPSDILVECASISKQKEAEYMLESYSKLAERNTRELQKEKDRVEKLLLNIMPKSVYEEMKDYGTTTPQRFEQATVLMLDFVDFTDMTVSRDPGALIAELNDIFSAFDRIVEMFDCERIKTIGDAYMAVAGMPEANPEHAANIAKVALRMRRYLDRRNAALPEPWLCRIGINTGPLIGSIVGINKYVYDIFGPAVNLAARMEQMSEPRQITVCDDTYKLLKDDFMLIDRGEYDIKGFGTKRLYFLESEQA